MTTPDEILDPASRLVVITPERASWNPQCTSDQLNEETHIDYYGHLTQSHHRTTHLIKDTDIHMDSVRPMAAEVNVPSNFFPAKSYLIDNIITSIPRFDTLKLAPWDKYLYSQDDTCIHLSAIDAALDPVYYAQVISSIADETDFACSMILAHELLSKTDSDQLFLWNH